MNATIHEPAQACFVVVVDYDPTKLKGRAKERPLVKFEDALSDALLFIEGVVDVAIRRVQQDKEPV